MNKTALDALLADFYTVSGMETSVLDVDFHTVAMARAPQKNICSLIHRAEGAGSLCKASDIEKLTVVRQSREPLVYSCPYGITEAIIPIFSQDGICGYVFSTVGFKKDTYGECLEALLSNESLKKVGNSSIERLSAEMRVLSDNEISAYLSMLRLLAEHIGNSDAHLFGNESIGALIKRYIKNNLSSKITLNDIARELHCSTVTLTERFKEEFGITIIDYVTKKRMSLAESLLISTDSPLREIAGMSGFADVEYFSRTFKKYHGISPAAWRKREKNEDGST